MKKRTLYGLLATLLAAGCMSLEVGNHGKEAESQLVRTPAPADRPVTADDITPENAHQIYQKVLDEIDRQ